MGFGFVDEHRGVWPISILGRVLGVSVSGDHARRSRPGSARSRADRARLDTIGVVHAESGGPYGARRASMLRCAPSAAGSAATGWPGR